MDIDLKTIQSLVGNITPDQMKYVDSYTGLNVGIFIPSAGQCAYAITKDHTHPSYSFVILTGKPLAFVVKDKTTVLTDTNSIISMSPGFEHHEKESDTFVRYYALFIKNKLFEETYKMYTSEDIPFFKGDMFNITIDLLPILKSFISEYCDKLPGYKRQLVFLEERITHLVIRNILNVSTSDQFVSNRFEIDRALEYISSNYMKKLSLGDIAGYVNYSSSHFSRLFKKEVRMTIPEYINYIRMTMAKKKIESGLENITEIAYSCGFSTPSHFSTAYKNHFKMKPSEYAAIMGKKARI